MSSADLYQLFAVVGNVASARVITSKETGKSIKYGFVEMTDENDADEVIIRLDGKVIKGRTISVARSKPKGADVTVFALRVRMSAGRWRSRKLA